MTNKRRCYYIYAATLAPVGLDPVIWRGTVLEQITGSSPMMTIGVSLTEPAIVCRRHMPDRTVATIASLQSEFTRILEAAVRLSLFRMIFPLLLALSGCHLLDQTDFQPRKVAVPALPPVPDPETRTALVTIDFAKANTDYATALTAAVQTVETKRPGSLYDVVAVVADAAGATMGRAHAADVMTTIEAAGVIPARIQLGLRLEPGRKIPQVRVYLR